MNEELSGAGETSLVVAKEVMAELIPYIPAELDGTLRNYGPRHSADPRFKSCHEPEKI